LRVSVKLKTIGIAAVMHNHFFTTPRAGRHFPDKAVVQLAWKKGVCHRRAAFDITFQRKTTFSLWTRNRPMNFAILPNFRNPSCYFVSG